MDASTFCVLEEYLKALIATHPRVDVPAEIRKLQGYARDNPAWAKNKRDWSRTLGNWLRRADERFEDERFKQDKPTAYEKSMAAIAAIGEEDGDEPGNQEGSDNLGDGVPKLPALD